MNGEWFPSMAPWISVIALLVSVASLFLSIVVAVRNIRIQTTQIKTELLSKLVDLRLEYARFNRRIQKLKDNPPTPLPKEIASLLSSEAGILEYERKTESHRRWLLDPEQKVGAGRLEEVRHHIEALLKQLADDNRRLDDILMSDSAVRRQELLEEFDALKRRIHHIGLINDLPVELHKLRAFLIEKGLIEEPTVRAFFAKWLTNPIIVMGEPTT